jgi:hydroxymethylpyrimidine pyrophosphatase-like HAD family hydrolase
MKKFENIVIASDLDGTYLAKGSRLVERNLERVRYFCANGGHFTFATGRVPGFVRIAIDKPEELINMPAVTANGACLCDFGEGKPLVEHFIDMDIFMKLADRVNEISDGLTFRGAGFNSLVVPALEHEINIREYTTFPSFLEKRVLPMSEWGGLGLYKVNVMGDKGTLDEIYPILQGDFSDSLAITRSGYTSIEVMMHGTSKANMLKRMVSERFGDDVMLCTVGDEDNDIEMHSVADLPVCPANANESIKKICKHCLCNHNDGVIGDLIDLLDREI